MTDRIRLDDMTGKDLDTLYEQRDEARQWARHGYEIGQRHCGWTDHGVAPAWLTEGWPPHIDTCEHLKHAADAETELAALRTVARGYCPHCGRGDAAPTVEDWEQQRRRADAVEAENDKLRAWHERCPDREPRAQTEAALDRVRKVATLALTATETGESDYDIGVHDNARAVLAALQPGPAGTEATDPKEQP